MLTGTLTSRDIGRRVLGAGVGAMAMVCLAWRDFDPGQAVPAALPGRSVMAMVAAIFMLVAGAALVWRRTAAWGAAALGVYYLFVVVILMDGRGMLAHPTEFGSYSNVAEQLAIAAGALVVFAANVRVEPAPAARLTRIGQLAFGVCAILFGGAHFFYLNLTVPLVPKWLPPSQDFWAYATGAGQIAAGVAMITKVRARIAALLLTGLYVSFTLLVHLPMLLADGSNHYIWSENALNLALIGVAWVVADSFGAATGALAPRQGSRRTSG